MENSNLMTSVDLSLTEKNNEGTYHFIYGSQLYGTLFGIFGKFDTEPGDNGNVCLVKKVTMKLMNYKGIVNVGFSKHKPFILDDKQVYFGVKGGRREYRKVIRFKKPLVIHKNNRVPLVFNRMLYPLKGFEFDIDERNERDNRYELDIPIPNTRIFDNEFQYRSGTGYFDRELRPGMLGYEGQSLKTIKEQQQFPSPRCHHSNVSLVFA